MAVDSSRPANQSATSFGSHRDGERAGPRRGGAAGDHQGQADDDQPALAEALADDAAGQREERAGQHVDPDEPADLRVAESEVADEERRHRGDRLELHAHRAAGDEHDRERHPAIGHFGHHSGSRRPAVTRPCYPLAPRRP